MVTVWRVTEEGRLVQHVGVEVRVTVGGGVTEEGRLVQHVGGLVDG